MVTLVVGNGFDLEHKLPTKYTDFLKFLDVITEAGALHTHDSMIDLYSKFNDVAKDKALNEELTSIISQKINDNYEEIIKLINIAKKNIWYRYFKNRYDEKKIQGDNWIDFESEISLVVKQLEDTKRVYKDDNPVDDIDLLINYTQNSFIYYYNDDEQYPKKFLNSLNDLSLLLYTYICYVDKMTGIAKSNNIIPFAEKVTHIISFNYTNTFNKLYSHNRISSDRIDFVHGQASEYSNNHIILGTEETLEDENSISKELKCVGFKKYYQRIIYQTGMKYNKFYPEDSELNPSNIAYVFGHSLSINDGDIIKFIIEHNNKVVFYYYNEDKLKEQVANLIRILGKDKVIEYSKSKFEFIEQEK